MAGWRRSERVGRVHVLTDVELQTRFSHVELAVRALEGGAHVVQFRQKTGSTRVLIAVARQMGQVCRAAGATFIVNDRVDVALASQADGVHLGQSDAPIPFARRLLGPRAIIGGSASTVEQARRCIEEGADYVGFGPVYPTGSKADAAPVRGLELLREVAAALPAPVIAIGGIDAVRARAVLRAGAQGFAVISAVCCEEDPAEATRRLLLALEEPGARHPDEEEET
ncbi:MAG: thiamine phosphate synthase [Deferrisomatales bacterium]|nr:thiamine phosphate synthase [Deferrisomatales bacterium]